MNNDEFQEDLETIIMQDEDGNDIEFIVMDAVQHKDRNYFLVTDIETAEDEEAEAFILKETHDDGEELFYEVMEDGEEFTVISSLFMNNDDYEIEL